MRPRSNEENPDYARKEYVGLEIPTLEEVFQRYGSSVNSALTTTSRPRIRKWPWGWRRSSCA